MHMSGHNSPVKQVNRFSPWWWCIVSRLFLFRSQISYVKHLAIIYRHVHYTMLRGILIVCITEDWFNIHLYTVIRWFWSWLDGARCAGNRFVMGCPMQLSFGVKNREAVKTNNTIRCRVLNWQIVNYFMYLKQIYTNLFVDCVAWWLNLHVMQLFI